MTCIPLDAYKDDGVGEVTPSRQQKLGVSFAFWWTDLSDFFKSIFDHYCIFLLFSSFFRIFHVLKMGMASTSCIKREYKDLRESL